MLKKIGLVLTGLGVFLIVLGLLSRFYAYDRLAVAPQDQDSVSTLVGPDAEIFDLSTLSSITTDLTTTARTVGDVEASEEAGDNTVVWVNTSVNRASDGDLKSATVERVAFDAHTGEAVNCCDEYIEATMGEPEPVEHHGLVFKFPFDTEKKDYDWWDSTLREAVPIEYQGVDEVDDVTVYKFSHTIEPTVYQTGLVPASILGLERKGNVEADRVYSNVRTLWVEPRTGVVVDRTEEQYNTIRYQGEDLLVTTDVNTEFSDETVQDNVDKYGPLSGQLNLIHNILPLIGVIGGLLLVLAGVGLLIMASRQEQDASYERSRGERSSGATVYGG